MNKIIKFFNILIIGIFLTISAFVISIQFQYVQNLAIKIVSKIIKDKTNINVQCKSFNIKSIFDFEIHDIKLTNDNEKKFIVELNKLLINLNPLNLLFNKTININNLLLKNIEIKLNLDNMKKNFSNNKININNNLNYNIKSKQVDIQNLTIIIEQNNTSEKYVISTLIENIDINPHNVNSKIISLKINNEKINIYDLKTDINYFFKTNTLYVSEIEIISKFIYLNVDVFISNLNNLINKGIINYNDKIKLKINKIKVPLKLLNNNIINNFKKYLTNLEILNSEIILENNNISMKKGNIFYLNNYINLDFNLNNINNKKKINYYFLLKNDVFKDDIIKKILNYDLKKILDFNIQNSILKITGNTNNILIQSNIFTSVSDIILNTLINIDFEKYYLYKNINNIINYIKSNIAFKNINLNKFLEGFKCKLLNINLIYDFNKNKHNIDIKINNFNYRNLFNYSLNCKNNIYNNEIKGIINIFNDNIKLNANTCFEYKNNNIDAKIDGDIFINNFFLKNLKINDVKCKINTIVNTCKNSTKITNILKNISFKKLNTNIITNDINTNIDINNDNLKIKTISDFMNMNLEFIQIKNLITNVNKINKYIYKNNKNIFEIIKNLNNFEESKIIINLNTFNSTFFNIFIFNNINFKQLKLDFNLLFNKNNYSSLLSLNANNLEINNFKLGNLSLINKNQIDENNILNSSLEFNRNIDTKNYNILFRTNIKNNIIYCNFRYGNNLSDILFYKFNIIENNNLFIIDFDNNENLLKFKNKKLINKGKLYFNRNYINFENFNILDKNKKYKIISINGINYYSIFDKQNNVNLNIDIKNLIFENIFKSDFILDYNNIYDNISLNLNFNKLSICDENFNNIYCFLEYNKSNEYINLRLKQIFNKKTCFNTEGSLFFKEDKKIQMLLSFDEFNFDKLNLLTNKMFVIKKGNITGNFYITGTYSNPIISGNGTINNLSFKINKIGCNFENGNAELFGFNNNELRIYSIKLDQYNKNCCNLTGSINFQTLLNPTIFINGKLNNCEIYNINDDNFIVNGNILGNGNIFLKYNMNTFNLNTSIDVINGNIILNNNISNVENNVKYIDSKVIAFKKYYNSISNKNKKKIDVSLNINLKIDDNLKLLLIFNKYNKLSATGNGNVNLKFINNSFKINGQYIFTNGAYNFHVYNLFYKTFNIKNGNIFFNNNIENTKIKVDAVANSYSVTKNNVKNIELNIKLNGFITSPNITYNVTFFNDNNIKLQEKYDLKNFFYILFFDNITNEQINNHSNEIINRIIHNVTSKYFKNLKFNFNFNFSKYNQKDFYKNFNFKTNYNYKNIFSVEKNTKIKTYKDLFNNISLKLLFLKNKGIITDIDLFSNNNLKDRTKNEDDNFNILSLNFNLQKKFY